MSTYAAFRRAINVEHRVGTSRQWRKPRDYRWQCQNAVADDFAMGPVAAAANRFHPCDLAGTGSS